MNVVQGTHKSLEHNTHYVTTQKSSICP